MTINLHKPDITELKPRITVFGVGGGGGNAVNNMITAGLRGVEFVVANTDAQALTMSKAERLIQLGAHVTEGLGAGSQPEVGRAAAEECIDEILDHLSNTHMCFVTAGMGGGTGTGAAPVVARAAREKGILTVGVVTKPFHFEGQRRMRTADAGIEELQKCVDTLIVIPNQNLFRIANDKTTFADAFAMADQVLYSGVACITDLMVKEGLINLDFADVRSIMRGMGKAMMGTGESTGEKRALQAAEAAIANPLLDETSMKGARGVLISISGGKDLTLFEVDEAATRIREEVDPDANIILGATFDDSLEGVVRVSVVATGIDQVAGDMPMPGDYRQPEPPVRIRSATPAAAPAPVLRQQPETALRPTAEPAFRPVMQPPVIQSRLEPSAMAYQSEAEARLDREMQLPEPPTQIVSEMAPVAVADDPAVTIQRYEPPVTSRYDDMADPIQEIDQPRAMRAEPAIDRRPYIPPTAERPADPRPHRMPRIDEFPPVAQRVAQPQAQAEHHDDDRRPLSLLKRLANGFGSRREEHDEALTQAPQAQPTYQQPPAQDYAKRPPQRPAFAEQGLRAPAGNHDGHGRQAPAQHDQQVRPSRSAEDEHLEIPAFLRRQAN